MVRIEPLPSGAPVTGHSTPRAQAVGHTPKSVWREAQPRRREKVVRRGPNEGTIRERADGRWEARVLVTEPDGRRVRRSLLGRTRTHVRDKLRDALRAEATGRPMPSDRLTVGAFLHQWLEDTVRPSTHRRTYSSYASIVRLHLEPGLGHLPLARLSPQQVQAFLNAESAARLSPRSVAMERAVLRGA